MYSCIYTYIYIHIYIYIYIYIYICTALRLQPGGLIMSIHIYAGACPRALDSTRVDATWNAGTTGRGTHTGDPHRGEGPTEEPPPEGRATQGTHTEHTQTRCTLMNMRIQQKCRSRCTQNFDNQLYALQTASFNTLHPDPWPFSRYYHCQYCIVSGAHEVTLYKIMFRYKALLWESIIGVLPGLRVRINPFVCRTAYNWGWQSRVKA